MKIPDEILIKRLNELGTQKGVNYLRCPNCGQNTLKWNNNIMELREYHEGNLVIGGNSIIVPIITATCSYCGYVATFNAITLGFIDKNTGKLILNDSASSQGSENSGNQE